MNRKDVEQVQVFNQFLQERGKRSGVEPIRTYVEQVQHWLELAEASLANSSEEQLKQLRKGAA